MGRAYAFFDCNASKEEIERELPFIRKEAQTPNQLELFLTEDASQLNLDVDLFRIAREDNQRYAMSATCSNLTNEKTADELANVLNQARQSPLYEQREQSRGKIVYEDNGEYLFRD